MRKRLLCKAGLTRIKKRPWARSLCGVGHHQCMQAKIFGLVGYHADELYVIGLRFGRVHHGLAGSMTVLDVPHALSTPFKLVEGQPDIVFFLPMHCRGVRPFGVSLLVAGYDSQRGPCLYQVDPSGSYFMWKASAIGKNMTNAKTFLEKR